MIEKINKISDKAGLPPGTLIHIGSRKIENVKITQFDFSTSKFTNIIYDDAVDNLPLISTDNSYWLDIYGLHNTEIIASIGQHFDLHPLLLEDVLNTNQRPKFEEFDNYMFLTLKMYGLNKNGNNTVSEQFSMVLSNNWVLSFQEQEGDLFDSFRMRLSENKTNILKNGTDYLMYRLLDIIVDNYFFVTEYFGEACEDLEEQVLLSTDTNTLHSIQKLKKELNDFRKSVTPVREAVYAMQRETNHIIGNNTMRYLHDVYEHIIQVIETTESHRETLANIMELYLNKVSNKMNETMQVLTIIGTIFIPLTFITGIYGMNFINMPELHWQYGYFGILTIMLIIMLFMIFYFKHKKWL